MSVVVPVRNRRALLARTLAALDNQTLEDFEVVVVDDGSTDGSGDLAASTTVAGKPVTVVRTEGVGAVRARIAGVARATGSVLAFTDSDCEPAPRWLETCVVAIDGGADLAHGPTQPAGPVRPLERTLWSAHEGLYPSCNVVVRRDAYDREGGFELRHTGRGSGEDTILAWRIRRKGSVEFVAEAVVFHAVLPFDFRDALRRAWDARDFPALAREVPEIRVPPLFPARALLGGPQRLPLYAALAAVGTRRPRWAIALLGLWARGAWRRFDGLQGTRADRVAALPAELAIDAVTGAALVVGSARHHTLVL